MLNLPYASGAGPDLVEDGVELVGPAEGAGCRPMHQHATHRMYRELNRFISVM
jgi:hypothetical protein